MSLPAVLPHWRLIVAVFTLLFLWSILINNLRVEWSVNPQYAYGWAVPFLCLFMLWRRGKLSVVGGRSSVVSCRGFVVWFAVGLALLLLPTRLVLEANPEWRLAAWLLTIEVIGLTLAAAFLAGGKPLLRWIAFPVLFFLVAVPWPTFLETTVIQGLTRANVALGLELLAWTNIPAIQHGNVIEISTGTVGIDEACSGIRSLQATLMIALFLGEFHRLSGVRRVALVAAGALMAFVFNVARTFLLVWVASRDGIEAIDHWHDPAGVTILAGCFFGLWGVAAVAGRAESKAGKSEVRSQWVVGSGQWAGVGRGIVLAFAGWVLVVEVVTEGWYRSREAELPAYVEWAVEWPEERLFEEREIAEATRRILRYNEGRHAILRGEDGATWQVFYLRWQPGRTATHLAKAHTPEVCLPAAGQTLVSVSDLKRVTVDGLELPFRTYVYERDGRRMHAFYSLWEDREETQEFETRRLTQASRFGPVLEGRRNRGQRAVFAAVYGIGDEAGAEGAFARMLEEMVVVGGRR